MNCYSISYITPLINNKRYNLYNVYYTLCTSYALYNIDILRHIFCSVQIMYMRRTCGVHAAYMQRTCSVHAAYIQDVEMGVEMGVEMDVCN